MMGLTVVTHALSVYFYWMKCLSRFTIIIGAILIGSLTGCSSTRAPITVHGSSEGFGSVGAHAVQPRDTLYSIANRYQLRFEDLAAVNGLSPPYALNVGQRLRLPPPKTYTVRAGDTLYLMSYMFELDVDAIAQENGIDDPLHLRIGDVLTLPSIQQPEPIATASNAYPNDPQHAIASSSAPAAAAQSQQSNTGIPTPERKPSNIARTGQNQQTQNEVNTASNERKPVVKPRKIATPKRASSKFLKPTSGRIVSSYGPKADGLHNDGVNIAAARGAAVKAADNGVVVYAGNGLKGSGNLILVRHDNRWMTAYGHLDTINVKNGAIVNRGSQIGTVGSTGAVKTPQLHFEVRRGTKALNPKPYLE